MGKKKRAKSQKLRGASPSVEIVDETIKFAEDGTLQATGAVPEDYCSGVPVSECAACQANGAGTYTVDLGPAPTVKRPGYFAKFADELVADSTHNLLGDALHRVIEEGQNGKGSALTADEIKNQFGDLSKPPNDDGTYSVQTLPPTFTTKDSGVRESFGSGMVRDTQAGKPRFDLILPLDVPYAEQFLTRWASLMARGAAKYTERNWELATGQAELDHAKAAAFRHFMQWFTGETDEDHGPAVAFNIQEVDYIKWKLAQ